MSIKDFQNGFALGMAGKGSIVNVSGSESEYYIDTKVFSSVSSSKTQTTIIYGSNYPYDTFPIVQGQYETLKFDLEVIGEISSSSAEGQFQIYFESLADTSLNNKVSQILSKTIYAVYNASNKTIKQEVSTSLSTRVNSDTEACRIYIKQIVTNKSAKLKYRISNIRFE